MSHLQLHKFCNKILQTPFYNASHCLLPRIGPVCLLQATQRFTGHTQSQPVTGIKIQSFVRAPPVSNGRLNTQLLPDDPQLSMCLSTRFRSTPQPDEHVFLSSTTTHCLDTRAGNAVAVPWWRRTLMQDIVDFELLCADCCCDQWAG